MCSKRRKHCSGVRNICWSPKKKLIRIGVSPLLDNQYLTSLLGPFLKAHPDAELALCERDMPDLGRMLDEEQLDYVFGVVDQERPSQRRVDVYGEALVYLPKGNRAVGVPPGDSVHFLDICDETFVLVTEGCGLTRMTRELFRKHRRKLREYSEVALSYRDLEQWAVLGIGAAIMPRSRISSPARHWYTILDRHGKQVALEFKAFWTQKSEENTSLTAFTTYMQTALPTGAGGLQPTLGNIQ